jgi:hypothetical protein
MLEPNNEMNEIKDELEGKNDFENGETNNNEEILNEDKSGVITQEIADKYGLSKTMVGKPMEELANAYSNLHKQNTQLSQKFAERDKAYEKKFADLEAKLTAKEATIVDKKTEKDTLDAIGEAPEPMDFGDPKEYKKALAVYLDKRDEIKQKTLMDTLEKKFGEQFGKRAEKLELAYSKELQTKNEAIMNETVQDGLKELYDDGLPEGMTVETVYADWLETIKDKPEDALTALYGGNPVQMAKDVLLFQKARLYDESKASIKDPKLAEKLHKQTVEKLKNNSVKATRLASSERKKPAEERDIMSEIRGDLETKAELDRET